MKQKFLNSSLNLVKKYYPNYSGDRLDIIRYGIEGLYLTLLKLIIIFAIAFILNIIKETLILFAFYTLIRSFSFGYHASKSWTCLLSSTLFFIGIPLICYLFVVPFYLKVFIVVLTTLTFIIYSPADTKKRPILPSKRKIVLKCLSVLTSIIFSVIILNTQEEWFANILLGSLVVQNLMIIPFTYKVFKQPYDNWTSYYTH